ncbi:MAG TPA: EamA family transporter [Gaiellaceae bacterium]|jgi:drug/metabolite transporter (DMT)-like permease
MRLAAALAVVYLVWGSTYLGIDVAERSMPPLLMLSVRFLIAGVLLWAWASRRGEVAAERPGLRQWRAAAIVGALLLVVETGAVAFSEKHIPTGVAALIVASVPLFMAIIDRAFFGIRIPLLAAVGILAGLAGVGLLAGGGVGGVNPVWALVLLGGALAWAAGSAYARVAPLPGGSVLSSAMQMLTASVILFVISAAKGDLGHVHASALSLTSVGSIAYLVGFGSILAYTAYGWLLRNAATPLLSTYAYVNPAVAVLLGWAFVGEHLGARELVAGLVVLASVALILVARRPAPAKVVQLPRRAPAPERAAA